MKEENELGVNELKELGNTAIKEQKYEESVMHYTHALKIDPKNYTLFSNRSLAFLKMQHYFLALQDANETITLNPTWAKGYFRKGEVEFATCNFVEAYKSYENALALQPNDITIIQAMTKTARERQKNIKADEQIPWLGAGIGIVLGVIIVIADYLYTSKPTNPFLMAISTICIAILGYFIAKAFRYYVKCQRETLLQPPTKLDVLEDETEEAKEETKPNNTPRYTKSQARQRYKKGKL